jgi:hypothetical protein
MNAREKIVWETDLRLFGPEMLKGWSLAMVATWVVMMLILGSVFLAQGEADALADMALVFLAVVAGLWGLGFLVMAVLFRGKFRVRYTASETGVLMETLDTVARKSNRLAIVLGALSGKPGLLGAGLIGRSREAEAVGWDGAFRAVLRPERHLIVFKGPWRSLMLVQCLEDNYARVAALVEREMGRHDTAKRIPGKSPLPAYLGRTALVALASFPIFALHEEYDLDVFLPLLMFCFALATVWLIPLFGWVVMGSLGLIAFTARRPADGGGSVLFQAGRKLHPFRGDGVGGLAAAGPWPAWARPGWSGCRWAPCAAASSPPSPRTGETWARG